MSTNGSELLRILAELQNRQSGANEGLAIWLLAVTVREINMQVVALNGALAGLIEDNALSVTPEIGNDLRKVHDVAKKLKEAMDTLVPLFEPLEAASPDA
jgi:hypothetical protein